MPVPHEYRDLANAGTLTRPIRDSTLPANRPLRRAIWEPMWEQRAAQPCSSPLEPVRDGCLLRIDRDELVLGIPWRDDQKATRKTVAGVPDRVSDSPWNEHERAGGQHQLALPEPERRLAIGHEEPLIRIRMNMKGWGRLARGNRQDFDYMRSVHLRRTEPKIPGVFPGRDHGASVDHVHAEEPRRSRSAPRTWPVDVRAARQSPSRSRPRARP